MLIKKGTYTHKNANGVWEAWHYTTEADLVAPSKTRLWMTPEERQKVEEFLSTFNKAGKLLQLDSNGKIQENLIPFNKDNFVDLESNQSISGRKKFIPGLETPYIGSLGYGSELPESMGSAIHLEGGTSEYQGVNIQVGTSNAIRIEKHGEDYTKNRISFSNDFKLLNNTVVDNPNQLVNKAYVDSVAAQSTHLVAAVVAATTANLANLSGFLKVDGIQLEDGDRVLVKDQTNKTQNGVYIVRETAWEKQEHDSDKHSLVSVINGTTQKRHQYYNDGTNWNLYWVDDNYGVIAGGGLQLDSSGFKFGIQPGGVTNTMLQTIQLNKLAKGSLADSNAAPYNSWSTLPTANATLLELITSMAGAIKLLRGTASFNTNNSETIASAHIEAKRKNMVRSGTTMPGETSPDGYAYETGDIYLLEGIFI